MKINYPLFFLLLAPFLIAAQQRPIEQLVANLDKSDMQTSILFNNALSFSEVGTSNKTNFDTYRFFQTYNELRAGDSQSRFLPSEALTNVQKQSYFSNIIPIGIVISDFDIIKEASFSNGDLQLSNGSFSKSATSSNIFETKGILAAAPFRIRTKGLQTTFQISNDFFINTTNKQIASIRINFDDQQGFRPVSIGDNVTVGYTDKGLKQLGFEVTFTDGSVLNSTSNITINYNRQEQNSYNVDAASVAITGITASDITDLSPYGEATNEAGQGEYQIFYDTVDGVLDKPIILVDGFDPGDTRDIAGIYSLLNYTDSSNVSQNLADYVRSQGFDVVILNAPQYTSGSTLIDGGSDYIERNAMVLVELINTINALKVGTEKNVIIGPSMGGLISRYALNYMESSAVNEDPDTRLWISFDAPHHGANIPLGFQHQFNFLAYGLGDLNVTELQPIVSEFLNSPAARQLLVDHFVSHLATNSAVDFNPSALLPAPHPFRAIFQSHINGLTPTGYPQTTRNVSMINGSGTGAPYQAINSNNVTPGYTVIDGTFPNVAPNVSAQSRIKLTPATSSGSQQISMFKATFLGIITLYDVSVNAQAHSYSNGVDAASGGLFDLSTFTDGIDTSGLVGQFLAALQLDRFSFIPSVSSMALEITNNQINWYHNISLGDPGSTGDTLNNTPFVNWYMPSANEDHVSLNDANVLFALSEIIPETLGVSTLENNSVKIEKNPITNELTILSSSSINNVKLSIVDITGKVVMNTTISLTNRTTFPLQLEAGLYILNLTTDTNTSYKTKLIVK